MSTTTAAPLRVGNYEFEKFIDIGGTSIVFRGLHWRLRESHGVHQYVALKLMWDLDVARDEMARLVDNDTVSEVCSLLDYFEVDYGEVSPVIEPFRTLLMTRDEPCDFSQGHRFAVVVLQFMAGTPLVITEPFDPDLSEPAETLSWFIRHDDRTWRQSLRWKLTRNERLRIINQMVAAIKDSHRRKPPIVHGDLNPANVLYDKATGRVRLIDYGILGRGGVEGWNSPWHYALGRGEIAALPPAADIYMLSHWIRRLLGDLNPAYIKLADQIVKRNENGSMTASDVQKELAEIETHIRGRRTMVLLTSVVAIVCIIWLAVLWQAGEKRNRLKTAQTIARYVSLAEKSDESFRQAQNKLLDFLYEPGNSRFYDQIVEGLAEVNRNKGSNLLGHLSRIDFSKPNVVMISPDQRVILFNQYPFFEGSYINKDEYILQFDWFAMDVTDGSVSRTIQFHAHPMEFDRTSESVALVWESDVTSVLQGLANFNQTYFLDTTVDTTQLIGVYYVDSVEAFIKRIASTIAHTWFGHEPLLLKDLERSRYAHWVFHKGLAIKSTSVYQFIEQLVEDQLGYQIEKIPSDLSDYQIASVIHQSESWDAYLRSVLNAYGYDFDLIEKDRESWVQIYQKEGGG